MTSGYPHLLSPGRIGSLTLRNRILMCPMGDNQATADGDVTEQQVAYFEARARGGAALLLVGSVGVTAPEGLASPNQSAIGQEASVDGWARLAQAVHAHDARLALQLVHNGKNAVRDIVAGRPLWVPSLPGPAAADPLMGMLTPDETEKMGTPAQVQGGKVVYREMTRDDIARMASTYAAAAERAQRAGVDAVELHAGHGYLIDAFLSPTTNFRDDEYGGPVENRARFLVEILAAVRERVGPGFPVWCRINGEEYFTEGQTCEDAVRVAQLAEAGGADAIHVSAYADPARAIGYSEAHATHTPGRFLGHAAAVKERVGVPVIAVGRLDPERAERALAEGKADFVAMGRKLLADPELPNKLAAGAPESVRPCLYHYRCISQIFVSSSVSCAANAFTGHEAALSLEAAASPRAVLVLGGGPAGMEAARLAALRGHRVTLVDAREALGGRFLLAAPTAEPAADWLRWLVAQVEALPIALRLGAPMLPEAVAAGGFDAVLVATGAVWPRPQIPGADLEHVRTVDELAPWLRADADATARRVVVIGGDQPGLGLARVARERGAAVQVLEETHVFARSTGLVGRWRYVHEAREQGVALEAGARVVEVDRRHVFWTDGEGTERETEADLVLVAAGAVADPGPAETLSGLGLPVEAIGDCRGFGGVEGAMRDATRAALAL